MMDLSVLDRGEWGYVKEISAEAGMKRRLMDLGFTRGARVECLLRSPFRGMRAYRVRGGVIALRLRDARGIAMEEISHG